MSREAFLKEYPNFMGRYRDADEIYKFLRPFLIGAGMKQSVRALGYMMRHHAGQKRDNGLPYVVHPMSMASHVLSMIYDENITDELISILFLHDVCEDCKVPVNELPFAEEIRIGVDSMSLIRFDDETKLELKKRFYNELPYCKNAVIGKGFDRYDNLKTMGTVFSVDKIRKNVTETDRLLLPALKKGEELWPEASNILRMLRSEIRGLNDLYAFSYRVKLLDPNFVNAPDAVDCYDLLSQEKAV